MKIELPLKCVHKVLITIYFELFRNLTLLFVVCLTTFSQYFRLYRIKLKDGLQSMWKEAFMA
jgi:hypothetical protein